MALNSRPRAWRPIGCVVLAVSLSTGGSSFAQQRAPAPEGRAATAGERSPSVAPPAATGPRASVADGATAATAAPAAALPYELRTVAARYPVTLYVTRSCSACDAGRTLLRQRGIPYAERVVADGDGDLLQRLTGGRELPALTIGSQSLRGFAPDQWAVYLDAAGYPRQSRLPARYPAATPVPLGKSGSGAASTAETPNDGSSAAGTAPARSDPPPPTSSPSGIRF